MYLGDLDGNATLQCLREVIGNSTDELEECGGGRIRVLIAGNVVTVADEGRGIPIEKHPKTKVSTLETVLTRLHAGAKSGSKTAYGKRTIGVHGVGVSVVNAVSSSLDVWTFRNGKWWHIGFERGAIKRKLSNARPPVSFRKGTVIRYTLDDSILKAPLDLKGARHLCNISRHFSPVTIEYDDGDKKATLEAKQPGDWLRSVLKKENLNTFVEPIVVDTDDVRAVFAWTNATDCQVHAHVSGAPVPSGTHVAGLEEAARAAVLSATKAKDCPNPLVGLRAVLDVTVDQPSFSGQAKTTLKTSSAKRQVSEAVEKPLTKALKNCDKSRLESLIEHATRISKMDADHEERKQLAREAKGVRGKLSFPKGYVAASSNYPPERTELFLMEGDSAAGGVEDAKMPNQAVLPLRGKMANVITKTGAIGKSEVVGNILRCVGYDPRFPDRPPRVGRVILLTDADDDGHHIAVLLLTIFQRVMPTMLQQGRVFVVKAPLFEAMDSHGRMVTGDSLADMEKAHGKLSHVNRMKGWGGAEVPLLRRVAFDPATRELLRVAAPDQKERKSLVELMGVDSSARKKLIEVTGSHGEGQNVRDRRRNRLQSRSHPSGRIRRRI
jgi:DNA gyrase subunit B/topoisomerase-4 subunit B